ncbi:MULTISPECIES: tol-pal system protein YbgF [unclassified Oceanobacter]|uniref:tol-pal system protein YbgF n=2 Tax=Gammaproteobacteria TaxID=1236 RepID=UPI0026E175B4|nr:MULTISPECIES: tol-pal system protein YbgF [unclassified Oceanobacter]MDO6682781.1 tol-pal system protein YbgF [Oceanobacter sp. 5_MG-2023]MDP2504853.1 tol-pal system protein YbgF [Oceanobacter sp. 3_MG-2023]MDP2546297.1 tol-pal system protein YbgF [Oceanobacter sp. 4_MG-2023]
MKSLYFLCSLALSASLQAEEWVSVGAAPVVTPASSTASVSQPAVTSPSPSTTQSGASPELVNELLMQVEQMQQEIAELRGQIERQSNELRQLKRDGDNRYLDLDRRIVYLTTEADKKPVAVAASAEASAQDVYNQAMMLVRDKKFEQANQAFGRFVEQYPEDELVANAWYWNGEVYLVRGEYPSALESFRTVIDDFPDHSKAADATYKYAVTLHKSGDTAAAQHWLETIQERYATSSPVTVRQAEGYLEKITPAQ